MLDIYTPLNLFMDETGSYDGTPRLDANRDQYKQVVDEITTLPGFQLMVYEDLINGIPFIFYEISPNLAAPADKINLRKGDPDEDPMETRDDIVIEVGSF